MFGLEIGDHRQMRRKLEERPIVLVGLAYHERRITDPCVGAEKVCAAADDDRRVGAGRRQQMTDDGSSRGFAVGAGDRHSSLQPHQFGEHFRPPHYRQTPLRRRRQLGMLFRHRGRNDQRIDALEVIRLVTVIDLRAEFGQPPRPLVVREIAAAHRQALSEQHLGDTAHADATDTHEVEVADAHAPPPIDSTRSAMRAAAFGSATSRAAATHVAQRVVVAKEFSEKHRHPQRHRLVLGQDQRTTGPFETAGVELLMIAGSGGKGNQQGAATSGSEL